MLRIKGILSNIYVRTVRVIRVDGSEFTDNAPSRLPFDLFKIYSDFLPSIINSLLTPTLDPFHL